MVLGQTGQNFVVQLLKAGQGHVLGQICQLDGPGLGLGTGSRHVGRIVRSLGFGEQDNPTDYLLRKPFGEQALGCPGNGLC